MNKHHELHVVIDAADAELLSLSGLPEATDVHDDCSNCGTAIGDNGEKFIPFALVLNDVEFHLLCLSCAAPVIRPRS